MTLVARGVGSDRGKRSEDVGGTSEQQEDRGEGVRLRVSPMDGSIMESRRTELKNAFSHIESLEIVEDRTIAFSPSFSACSRIHTPP